MPAVAAQTSSTASSASSRLSSSVHQRRCQGAPQQEQQATTCTPRPTSTSGPRAATGFATLAPPGTYIKVAPRSGLAIKDIDVVAGVIDPDYRGEIKVVLANHGTGTFKIEQGARIAQLILERIVTNAEVVQVEGLTSSTSRASAGLDNAGLAYLSMDAITEDEPISEPCAVHRGSETTTGVGTSSAGAGSEVPPH